MISTPQDWDKIWRIGMSNWRLIMLLYEIFCGYVLNVFVGIFLLFVVVLFCFLFVSIFAVELHILWIFLSLIFFFRVVQTIDWPSGRFQSKNWRKIIYIISTKLICCDNVGLYQLKIAIIPKNSKIHRRMKKTGNTIFDSVCGLRIKLCLI